MTRVAVAPPSHPDADVGLPAGHGTCTAPRLPIDLRPPRALVFLVPPPLQMERGLKSKAHWDSFGHKAFCEICKEEVGAGNRPVSYLNKTGYKNLQQKFLARTGRNYERKQFKNRWDFLKKEYGHWVAFRQAATGQRWDSTLGTVDADNEWWVKLIEAHPEFVKFRNGPPENVAELAAMFDETHVTVSTSAIPGEHIEADIVEVEDANDYLECYNDLECNNDLEYNKASDQKAKGAEKRGAAAIAASPKKKPKQQKNPTVQECKHVANLMAGSTSGTSSNDLPRGHGIKDVIKLAVQSGAKECSDLLFTATKLFMNVDYRELFSAFETNEGRLDWLNRMHEEMKKK